MQCSGGDTILESEEPVTWRTVIMAASGLTNLLPIAGIIELVLRRPKVSAALGWMLLAALVLNSQWWILSNPEERASLRAGYYLWWLAYLPLGAGSLALSRPRQSADACRKPPDPCPYARSVLRIP